ncbi:MAG TPA: biotin/lipoyl-containing protein [Gemmatimonadota bacterium]
MSGERRFWVTPPEGGPYDVELRSVPGGWEVTVERDGARRSFRLAAGDRAGEAWSADRLIRYRWDPAHGRLSVAGWTHELRVESDAAHRVAELGLAGGGGSGPARIRAPMPGLVLALEVVEGERVEEGQGLLIIEAMKMENEIRAPAAGIVRRLAVSAGDAVEREALLCEIEPPSGET